MRKIAILVTLLAIVTFGRPASASCRLGPCPPIVEVLGYTLLAGMIGGYATGTGYYVYHDATDAQQTLRYGGGELAVNAGLGALFTGATVDAIQHHRVGTTLLFGALAGMHGTLAVHGAWRIHEEWDHVELGEMPPHTTAWLVGIAYGTNAIVWTAGWSGRHGRTYGVAEASINAPIAAGLAYRAVHSARDGARGPTLLWGSMAAVSGLFAYHGLRTAIAPPSAPGLDLLGTDLIPVAVSDGRNLAPGLAVTGSW